MVTTLRDAKTKSSHLLRLVEKGEDVMVSVRGKPKARLSSVTMGDDIEPGDWIREIRRLHRSCRVSSKADSAGEIIDELREDRF